jgi:hypothetical protein
MNRAGTYVNAATRVAVAALLVLATASLVEGRCVDVRDVGAVGDGIHDDTVAIQTAIQSAITRHRGSTVCLPPGDYRITRTITIDDVQGIRLIGEGGATRFVWDGDERSPLLLLSSVQDAELKGFQILAARPLDVGIQCITRAGSILGSKRNMFVNLRIDGITRGVRKGFQIGGAGVDVNNDFHVFVNCTVANYANIAYSIENTQVYGLNFINCVFVGYDGAQVGVATNQNAAKGGSFSWTGGGGGNNQVADFFLGDPNNGVISITNAVFEKSARFLRSTGPSGAVASLEINGVRWSGDAIAPDGVAVDYRMSGLLSIRNSRFGSDPTKALTFSWQPGGAAATGIFVFEANVIRRASGSAMFVGRQPTSAANNVQY